MANGRSPFRIADLRRRLSGFGFLHAANAIWSMSHTLVQLVVMARVLPSTEYAAVVAVTAVGLYLQPVSQACARANYVALRAHIAGKQDDWAPPEVTALLYASPLVTLTVSTALSFVVIASADHKLALLLYLIGAVTNNFWYYDLQFSLWAVNFTTRFERLSFIRRVFLLSALVPFYLSGDLLVFSVLINIVSVVFVVILARVAPDPRLLLPSNLRRLTWPKLSMQARRFATALLSTLSELIVFSAPYAIIFATFGLGSAMVAFDSVLKLTRIAVTVTRNISEIALPRQSRAQTAGDGRQSMRLFGMALGGALTLNTVLALGLALFGDFVFKLMLGPNNVLPPGAGVPAAWVQIAATVYGASSFFLALTGHDRQVVWLTGVSAAAMAAFAAAVVALHPAVIVMLWGYGVFLAIVAAVSAVLVVNVFSKPVAALATSD